MRPLADSVGADMVLPVRRRRRRQHGCGFRARARSWGEIDFLVHAIGFADKQYLRGRYVDTPRDAFLQALDISCFSLHRSLRSGRRR